MRDRLAVITSVWTSREYRAFILVMVFLSLSVSSTLPLVTLYLVEKLHVSLSLASIYFVVEAFFGLALGLVVGRWSDRWRSRLPAMRLATTWAADWLATLCHLPELLDHRGHRCPLYKCGRNHHGPGIRGGARCHGSQGRTAPGFRQCHRSYRIFIRLCAWTALGVAAGGIAKLSSCVYRRRLSQPPVPHSAVWLGHSGSGKRYVAGTF